jgi:hypothetical protein
MDDKWEIYSFLVMIYGNPSVDVCEKACREGQTCIFAPALIPVALTLKVSAFCAQCVYGHSLILKMNKNIYLTSFN